MSFQELFEKKTNPSSLFDYTFELSLHLYMAWPTLYFQFIETKPPTFCKKTSLKTPENSYFLEWKLLWTPWGGSLYFIKKICIFGKNLVGTEKLEENIRNLGKKITGEYQMMSETNFQHTFSNNLRDPPGTLGCMRVFNALFSP